MFLAKTKILLIMLFAAAAVALLFSLVISSKVEAQEPPRCYVEIGEEYGVWNEPCPGDGEDFPGGDINITAEAGKCYLIFLGAFPIPCDHPKINNNLFQDPNTNINTQQALDDCKDPNTPIQDNCIVKRLVTIINFLGAGVVAVVGLTLVFSGIQYTTAGGNAQTIASAREKITWALIALALYALMWGMIQWLLPGGVAF